MTWLVEPFQYEFMRQALLAAVLVGATCALLGVYVVNRRMAFVGDALAHTTLPGVAVAYLCGASLSLGALAAGVTTALLIGWASRRQTIREDTAIGVVFTGMFAAGVMILTRANATRDLSHILFGNILGVSETDLMMMAGVFVVVAGCLAAFHKELELASYDPAHAEAIGINTDRLRYLLLLLLALTVVSGIQAVGVILTSALLVTPAATAGLVTRRLTAAMAVSATIAIFSAAVGLLFSYHARTSTGAAIVLCATAMFVVTATVRGRR